MRNLTKRLIVMLLAVVLVASLLPAAHAASSVKDFQDAIVETAMAYYYKGPLVQYDSTAMTAQSRLSHGESRISSGDPPEWAADDNTLFTVCSDFAYTVVYNACGYKLMDGSRNAITRKMAQDLDPATPGIVFYTGGATGKYDAEAAIESEKLLQPGDVVTYYNTNKGTGHSTVFVGDVLGDGKKYFCNSNGKKIDLKTGVDKIDSERNSLGGSVRLDDYSVLFYEKGAFAYVGDPNAVTGFSIIRPAQAAADKGLTLTDAAKTRLERRGLDVKRETSVKKYNSVQTGDTITVTLTLTNHGKADLKGVSVAESAPTGAAIVPAQLEGGLTASATGVTGKVDIPVDKTVTFSYNIATTAKQGETVTIPAGKVEGLSTRPLTFEVGGKQWSEANLAVFAETAKKADRSRFRSMERKGDLDFANAVYRELFGIELGLPAEMQTLRDTLETWTKIPGVSEKTFGGQMLYVKRDGDLDADALRLKKMMIPEHQAGWAVYVREDVNEIPDTLGAVGRAVELKEEFYQPGDIFFGYVHQSSTNRNVFEPDVFVYLGSKKAVGFIGDPSEVKFYSFDSSIGQLLREDVLFAMRPTLVIEDVNALVGSSKPLPFTDVTEADWFYTYVKDLYNDGTVNGMTATTFVPKGNLTYGQALKLIVCALGHGEQAPVDGGHWASGYLKFAQSKGWIADNVDLNGNVTRLAFCRIAAKAKNLTDHPDKNPFTDTFDADVLALYKAGVINGMTETTFEPDGLLTRAQISKIIHTLRGV